MPQFKLGRKALKTDSRTLKLAKYFTSALPSAPSQRNWHNKGITNFGEMLNNSIGDCTIAGIGHAIQIWSSNASKEITIPDSTILNYYEQWCGYVNGDPSTDNGGVELDILNQWKAQEFAGHKLLGYADPNVSNLTEVKQAVNLFGGLYVGMSVPNSVMNNPDPSIVWDVVQNDGGIAGGHCVQIAGYNSELFSFVSWGQIYRMTHKFWLKYVDEAHALLSQDWLTTTGSPSGFNLIQLTTDLAAII